MWKNPPKCLQLFPSAWLVARFPGYARSPFISLDWFCVRFFVPIHLKKTINANNRVPFSYNLLPYRYSVGIIKIKLKVFDAFTWDIGSKVVEII